jgi:hypothetical protein
MSVEPLVSNPVGTREFSSCPLIRRQWPSSLPLYGSADVWKKRASERAGHHAALTEAKILADKARFTANIYRGFWPDYRPTAHNRKLRPSPRSMSALAIEPELTVQRRPAIKRVPQYCAAGDVEMRRLGGCGDRPTESECDCRTVLNVLNDERRLNGKAILLSTA